MDQLYLKVKEGADVLNISERRMYDLVLTGQIRSVKIGRVRRIPVSALQEFADRLNAGESGVNDEVEFSAEVREPAGAPRRSAPWKATQQPGGSGSGPDPSGDGNAAA